MRVRFGFLGAFVLLFSTTALAHRGASSWGPFFRERYLVCGSDNLDHDCLGVTRAGRRSIVTALRAGESGDLSTRVASRLHDAAAAAQLYGVTDARDPARALLARTVAAADEDTWKATAIRRARVAGAMTLAALGDDASGPAILDLVRELETRGSGTLWLDALTALAELNAAAAGEYGAEVLATWEPKDMRWSMPGGTSRDSVLRFVEAHPTPKALEELRRLSPDDDSSTTGHGTWCELRRARIRVGDAALRREVKATFAKSASGTWVAGCDGEMVRAFGTDPADVDLLLSMIGGKPRPDRAHTGVDHGVTNIAYGRVLELIVAMQAMPTGSTHAARSRVRRELRTHAGYPLVSKPGHEDFSRHYLAFNNAALAGVGDREAQANLFDMITEANATDGAPWLAAYWALRLGLPGADDAVAERLRLGARTDARWKGDVFRDIRERTLDVFVERHDTDARWTTALLDGDMDTRERALFHLSRRKTLGACDAVFTAAPEASKPAVENAMLSLTTLGTHCRPHFERAIRDVAAPPRVRGMAFEVLAMMGSPLPAQLANAASSHDGMKIYIDRAEDIAAALKPDHEKSRVRSSKKRTRAETRRARRERRRRERSQ